MSPVTENKPHQTDPRTFAVRAITMLSQMVLPIAFGAFTILDEGEIGDIIVYLVPLAIIIVLTATGQGLGDVLARTVVVRRGPQEPSGDA